MNPITRRSMLSRTLAGGMAMTLPGRRSLAAPFSRPIGANDDIRVAVIGMGGFKGVGGRGRQLIGHLKHLSDVRITTLCDVDETLLDHEFKKLGADAGKVKTCRDMRQVFDDPEIDAVFIATPNHWHALATIWACQAGKDVYVEKPVSYTIWEGRQMVEAAKKYGRIVQTGTQARSSDIESQLADYVRSGALGKVRLVRALIYRQRESIGKVAGPQPVPTSVDYNLWLGPAPEAKLARKEFHYDWHWVWPTGNGEIGNNGVHMLDKCRWFMGEDELPRRAMSVGGRFQFNDDGQTPNTQIAYLDYESAPIICEVRGLPDRKGSKAMSKYHNVSRGIIFECEGGSVVAGASESSALDGDGQKIKTFHSRQSRRTAPSPHQENFIAAMRSRKDSDLNAGILDGHLSAALCHMANTSYRIGATAQPDEIVAATRSNPQWIDAFERFREHARLNEIDLENVPAVMGPWVTMDSASETFVGDFAGEANQLLRRRYREPFVVPESV